MSKKTNGIHEVPYCWLTPESGKTFRYHPENAYSKNLTLP